MKEGGSETREDGGALEPTFVRVLSGKEEGGVISDIEVR